MLVAQGHLVAGWGLGTQVCLKPMHVPAIPGAKVKLPPNSILFLK